MISNNSASRTSVVWSKASRRSRTPRPKQLRQQIPHRSRLCNSRPQHLIWSSSLRVVEIYLIRVSSTRWTNTCHKCSLGKAPKKTFICSEMCSLACRNGAFRRSKPTRKRQCPPTSLWRRAQTAKNCNCSRRNLCKRFARWHTRWSLWTSWARAAPYKSWKKTANGKTNSIRCKRRRRRSLRICSQSWKQLRVSARS